MTWMELGNRHAPHVSICTIDQVLQETNIKKCWVQTRPHLNGTHARKRLAWAMARKDWLRQDFEGILYSDECTFRKSTNPKEQSVFWTPQEK